MLLKVYIQTPLLNTHCSGVIVNQNHILTSARCVRDGVNRLNPFWLKVIAGDLNIITPTYRRLTTNVTHIFTHPQYNPNNYNNDIAVIRVCIKNNFTNLCIICIYDLYL